MAWEQFYVMSLTPGFSAIAAEGIIKDYPGACALSTGPVSCVFHLLPHLFCTLAVVATAIIEQCLCFHARSRDEKCRSCIMSQASSASLRNISQVLSCFTGVKSAICSKYPPRQCLLISPIFLRWLVRPHRKILQQLPSQ